MEKCSYLYHIVVEGGSPLNDPFIHFCRLDQLPFVLEQFYCSHSEVTVCIVPTQQVQEHLVWEEGFPHVYHPFDEDWIKEKVVLVNTKGFILPEHLNFQLDPALESGSVFLCPLRLCELRLMKDGEVDWFLLIPRRNGIVEWMDMSFDERTVFIQELNLVCDRIKEHAAFDKMNMGSLGNITSQFHWHIIARKKSDRAWPSAIWGTSSSTPWSKEREHYWTKVFEGMDERSTNDE